MIEAPKTPPAVVQSPAETDLTYSFKISRRAYPKEFRNLWELIVKTPTDTKPMQLIDADSLETIISRIRLIFEQDGL